MHNVVLDYWIDVFTRELQENTDDPLKMTVVKRAPLQDDPIRKAPYLTLTIPEEGIVPEGLVVGKDHHIFSQEIGGSQWWIVPIRLVAAGKSQKTSDRAHYVLNLLTYRILHVIRRNALTIYDAPQGVLRMENRDWNIFRRIYPHVSGGEGEWQNKVEIDYIARCREIGPFPYGVYPGDYEYA